MGQAATRGGRTAVSLEERADWRRGVHIAAVVGVAYAVGSLSSYFLFGASDIGVAFFPAAGVSAAALVLVDRHRWPWVLGVVFAAELGLDLVHDFSVVESTVFAAANTIEPLVGIALLLAWTPTVDLRRRRDMALFTVAAALVGPAVGGLVGALGLPDSYEDGYLANAFHWWAGDGLGVLVVGAPIIALWRREDRRELAPPREVALLLALTTALAVLVFWHFTQPFVFLVGPVLLWAAFRLGVGGVALGSVVAAALANAATATGRGPFAALDDLSGQAQLGMTQLFLAVVVLTSWFFAVEIRERERATAQGRAERTARDRLSRLQDLTARLASTATVDDVGRVVLLEAASILGVEGAGLFVLDEDDLLKAVATSPPLPAPNVYESVLRDADLPTTYVVATGQPVFYDRLEDLADTLPDLQSIFASIGLRSGGALPLRSDGHVVGALSMADRVERVHDEEERALAMTVAEQVGQAVGRARLLERERRLRRREAAGRARAELLADVAAGLEREVGLEARARIVVDLLVPAFADYVSVEQVRDGEVRLLALAHRDPAKVEVLRELRAEHRLQDGRRGSVSDVAVRRRAASFGAITPELIATYDVADRAKELLLGLAPVAHMTVPVGTAAEVTGALLVGRSDPSRLPFDEDDVALAEEIGWRTGLALENARLYEHAREVALRLQRSLLADPLVASWDVACAARYDPSVDELEVGGDWYDTMALPDGRIGIAVGDVVGRGLEAAATMGRLRTALAAIAADADGPGDALGRLDRFARRITGAECASCVYAEIHPGTGELRHASAGHPPALVRSADGTTEFLRGGRSPLLGVGAGRRAEAVVHLQAGATVVLYSDGLVERRREHLDLGFERLAEVVSSLDDDDLDRFCDAVVDRLTEDQVLRDDVVALCVRYDGPPRSAFRLTFPADPGELAGVRDALRSWMDEAGITPELRDTVLVTAGEACANAAEHAYLGADGHVELLIDKDDHDLSVTVRDRGVWRPLPMTTDRGRGTLLMQRLTDDFVVRSDRRGTEVRLTHHLRQRAAS